MAAFLVKQGRRDALRWMWGGVAVAIAICLAVGIALEALSRQLPYKQQEALETIVGLIAVGFVTFMIVWMRRNARGLKRALEGQAENALARGSAIALVAMAFFAVIREGFETAVFLLAAFDASTSPVAAGGGAVLGIAVAVVIGYGIYRGGVHINLARFFRITGVAARPRRRRAPRDLVAHRARGRLVELRHGQAFDLTWLVEPGSVHAALLTGMLGLQPRPTVGEVAVYLLYASRCSSTCCGPSAATARFRHRRRHGAEAPHDPSGSASRAAPPLWFSLRSERPACGSEDSASGANEVDVKITNAGCEPAELTIPAGATTFNVTNDGADEVTEFEVLDGEAASSARPRTSRRA